MKFIRDHWYDLGLIPLIIALVCQIVFWQSTDLLQKLALFNFMVIFWHQFEEYRFPGGEAAITNLAMQPSKDGSPDRYPLNQNNALFINWVAGFLFYGFPIIFPHTLWVAFAPVVFGMSQIVIHVFMTPRKIGNHIYSPGSCAVVFGHWPVAICWFWYTISHGLFHWTTLVFGILYLAFFMGVVMMKVGYGILKKPDNQYPFPEDEFERGGYAERIRNLQKS